MRNMYLIKFPATDKLCPNREVVVKYVNSKAWKVNIEYYRSMHCTIVPLYPNPFYYKERLGYEFT